VHILLPGDKQVNYPVAESIVFKLPLHVIDAVVYNSQPSSEKGRKSPIKDSV